MQVFFGPYYTGHCTLGQTDLPKISQLPYTYIYQRILRVNIPIAIYGVYFFGHSYSHTAHAACFGPSWNQNSLNCDGSYSLIFSTRTKLNPTA